MRNVGNVVEPTWPVLFDTEQTLPFFLVLRRPEKYLSQILAALDLVPSINFVPSNFNPSDLFTALFASSVLTLKVRAPALTILI